MKTNTCFVVCAGPCDGLEIKCGQGDMLIAADGGYAHCVDAGLVPMLYVGDLDSLPDGYALSSACERIVLPTEKDDTDTLSACKEGLRRGFRRFEIHAALGGDVGHEIANIQLLAFLHKQGASAVLYGGNQQVHLVTPDDSPRSFCASMGMRVSVFAYGGAAYGVVEHGLHWELEGAQMTQDAPIGVSNRVEDEHFEIGLERGMLIVVIG